MKFKINGCEWQIKELSQNDIRKEMLQRADEEIESKPELGRYFGVTFHDVQIIYLDKNLPNDRKRKTLIHELTHCYISCYITHQEKNYDEEMVADIVANSHDIICGIVGKYFKNI